jgi:hypothetical protein
MSESGVLKFPKYDGEMVRGSTETLGRNFSCTRGEPKTPEELRACRVQSYYCKKCGYTEFYKEMKQMKK